MINRLGIGEQFEKDVKLYSDNYSLIILDNNNISANSSEGNHNVKIVYNDQIIVQEIEILSNKQNHDKQLLDKLYEMLNEEVLYSTIKEGKVTGDKIKVKILQYHLELREQVLEDDNITLPLLIQSFVELCIKLCIFNCEGEYYCNISNICQEKTKVVAFGNHDVSDTKTKFTISDYISFMKNIINFDCSSFSNKYINLNDYKHKFSVYRKSHYKYYFIDNFCQELNDLLEVIIQYKSK